MSSKSAPILDPVIQQVFIGLLGARERSSQRLCGGELKRGRKPEASNGRGALQREARTQQGAHAVVDTQEEDLLQSDGARNGFSGELMSPLRPEGFREVSHLKGVVLQTNDCQLKSPRGK